MTPGLIAATAWPRDPRGSDPPQHPDSERSADLQAVEIATAIVMGAPPLVKEGLSWREVRLRAMHASPVELAPAQGFGRAGARETA